MKKISQAQKIKIILINIRRKNRFLIRKNSKLLGDISSFIVTKRGLKLRVVHSLFKESYKFLPKIELKKGMIEFSENKSYRCMILNAPKDFRYEHNPTAVLSFIYEIRNQVFIKNCYKKIGKRRFPSLYICLDDIIFFDVEAALILTAELDRIRILFKFNPILVNTNWDPAFRAFMKNFGMYDVIEGKELFINEAENSNYSRNLEDHEISVIKFMSSYEVEGKLMRDMRDQLYDACAPFSNGKYPIYDGLVEAITNTVQHAYPPSDEIEGDGLPVVKRWWAGAVVDRRKGWMKLVVYDQGVGIPATLKRKDWLRAFIAMKPERNDAEVITGALEYGRTSIDRQGRGNGLFRMCKSTEHFSDANVTFTSRSGAVRYSKDGSVMSRSVPYRFCGTMVKWQAKIV